MLSVYTLNCRLEIPTTDQTVESLFPSGGPATPQHYFRESAGIDPGLWKLFDPIFDNEKAKQLIRWGAISVIGETRSNKASPVATYRYLWRYWLQSAGEAATKDRVALQEFIQAANDPDRKPQMVLPASLAEAAFAFDSEYQLNPTCVLVLPTDAQKPLSGFLATERHSIKEAPKHWFSGLKVDEEGWHSYVDGLKKIARDDEALIYLPAITFSINSRSPLLAGGAVFCVRAGELENAITRLPEVQLYLRWVFSEVLKFCRLGHESNWRDRLDWSLTAATGQKYFSNESHVLHEYDDIVASDEQVRAERDVRETLGMTGAALRTEKADQPEMLWQVGKLLVLGEKRRTVRVDWFIDFVQAAIGSLRRGLPVEVAALPLTDEIRDVSVAPGQGLRTSSEKPARAVMQALLCFLDKLPRPGQGWRLAYRRLADSHAVVFMLVEDGQVVDVRPIVSAWMVEDGAGKADVVDELNKWIAVDSVGYRLLDSLYSTHRMKAPRVVVLEPDADPNPKRKPEWSFALAWSADSRP